MMFSNQKRFHFDNRDMQKWIGPYWLYQIGDLSCIGDYHVERHRQFVYEITYVASGIGHICIRDKWYVANQGSVFIHRIGDIHEMQGDKTSDFRYFYLGFDFKDTDSPVPGKLKAFFDDDANVMVKEAPGVQEAFLRLFNEAITQDFFTETLVEGHIHDLLVHVYRAFSQQKYLVYHAENEQGSCEKLVYDVVNYIDLNMDSMKKLTELSDIFGYSYSHIAKQFTEMMGESLQKYFMRRRFELAGEHLCEGLSVTEVAERMGYQSIHAFSRAFRQQMGMTPSAYKDWIETNKHEQ